MFSRKDLPGFYRALRRHYISGIGGAGPRAFAPLRFPSPFAALIAAVLLSGPGQAKGLEVLNSLREAGASSPAGLDALSRARLEEILAPCGQAAAKSVRLSNLNKYLAWKNLSGRPQDDPNLECLKGETPETLRAELLGIRGIGLESADFILLYALGYPVVPGSAAAWRILTRHGLLPEDAEYDELRELLLEFQPEGMEQCRELRELLRRCGNDFCQKNKMACGSCPLGAFMEY